MGQGISYITFQLLESILKLPSGWRVIGAQVIGNRELIMLRIDNTPFADGQEIKGEAKYSEGCLTGKQYVSGFSWVPIAGAKPKYFGQGGICRHCKMPLDDHNDDGTCNAETAG